MSALDGLNRTTTSVETISDDHLYELNAARKSLRELTDKNETLRLTIIALQEEIAKLKGQQGILPPWGVKI